MDIKNKGDESMIDTNLANIIGELDNLNKKQTEIIPNDSEISKEINEFVHSKDNKIIDDYIKTYPEDSEHKEAETSESNQDDSFRPTLLNINTICFSDWFHKHVNKFDEINELEFDVEGIAEKEILMVTIPTGSRNLVNGMPERRLEIIRNVGSYMVLDKDPESISFFTNGLFGITYDIGDGQYIISYASKTGLINFYAVKKDDMIIPIFPLPKMKRKETEFNVYKFNNDLIDDEMLSKEIDLEVLLYHYKQASKVQETLKNNHDTISWLLLRKKEMIDLNHWIIIDNLIITILNLDAKYNISNLYNQNN